MIENTNTVFYKYLFTTILLFNSLLGFGQSKFVSKSALIPQPQSISWDKGAFIVSSNLTIGVYQDSLVPVAIQFQKMLEARGLKLGIKKFLFDDNSSKILLRIGSQNNIGNEAYSLKVTTEKVLLTGATAEGVYRGLSTVMQLMATNGRIPSCTVEDAPAFPWRAYMVDVGRNFQSIRQLKDQIEVMAAYKLNVLHFHLTEDLAWRWQMNSFPALTDERYMERGKGKFYTREEILDLNNFCKQRFITLVPEIDIPGHSAAFRRALGVDMQSDTGIQYLRTILKEVACTYGFKYLHIGGDEVKVKKKSYLKEMAAFVDSLGLKTIAWDPGAETNPNTIHQLWVKDGIKDNKGQYIDSRHLYLNHMDPQEAITTIYNRKIGGRPKGESSLLGATLCLWHDRNVRDEKDLLLMNPVYPGIIAFAERVWRGGGVPGWITNVNLSSDSFYLFEKKLLQHKQLYFKGKPFPFINSGLEWNLIGPFQNLGNTALQFDPELNPSTLETAQVYKKISAATIVLRHWWHPAVQGLLDSAQENTTWYAYSKIYSKKADTVDCYIGFFNISRSMGTKPPPKGSWDQRGSRIWINGIPIPPPLWKNNGKEISLETPLQDESYEYRLANRVPLKKGWNVVLVKLPVASFTGENWSNPVKWMFSFMVDFSHTPTL